MRKRRLFAGLAVLAILLTLVVWQVSFKFNDAPANATQTVFFWAISTLIFVLTVTLSFMLFRTGVKLYLERQRNREGSRLQSKFFLGALALSFLPVVFQVLFSYVILNRTVEKWFSRPAEGVRLELIDTGVALGDEVQGRADALAKWISALPEARDGTADFAQLCKANRIAEMRLEDENGVGRPLCPTASGSGELFTARAQLGDLGTLVVRVRPRADLAEKQQQIQRYVREYDQLSASKRSIRNLSLLFAVALALFILFVATWIALLLSRQISGPIAALLEAAAQVRQGNLASRVREGAIDELATLVRSFNEMMNALESNSQELENRRRSTETILESIPTGVITLSADGRIQHVNRALQKLFPSAAFPVEGRTPHLADLFSPDDLSEIGYLMKRARRTGIASSQLDVQMPGQLLHLAVVVSALPSREGEASGFVVVLEDTSELLRAQKVAAWHEVARRIAHELKNPLTPIALCAERIARQLDRGASSPEAQRILRECSATISREVESVKTLADEFSRFSRFPAAQPVPCALNEIVRNALDVFAGRLEGIELRVDLAPSLPAVNLDPEQFKRVVVNLVDNAAEAMRDSFVKRLLVVTRLTAPETVELLVADSGCGISAEDKEKLFLPYFSTKGRGTGLGLAIVSHILSEHGARIRVEDNRPAGARFYVELTAVAGVEEVVEEAAEAAAGEAAAVAPASPMAGVTGTRA
jgi:two-component system nitrogen regulation sensor histidine kinase NtrY